MTRQATRLLIRQHFECFVKEGGLKNQLAVVAVDLHNALPHQKAKEIFEIRLDVEDAVEFKKYLDQANPHPFIVYERDPLHDKFKKDFAGRTTDLEYLIEGVNGWVSYPKIPATKFDFTAKGPIRILAS